MTTQLNILSGKMNRGVTKNSSAEHTAAIVMWKDASKLFNHIFIEFETSTTFFDLFLWENHVLHSKQLIYHQLILNDLFVNDQIIKFSTSTVASACSHFITFDYVRVKIGDDKWTAWTIHASIIRQICGSFYFEVYLILVNKYHFLCNWVPIFLHFNYP